MRLPLIPVLFTRRKVVSDTFTRADNAASLGNAETGQAWEVLSGTWGISSNRAYIASTSGGRDIAVVDSGFADVTIGLTLPVVATSARLIFRLTDASNHFIFTVITASNNYTLSRIQAGTATVVGSYTKIPANGDFIKVTLRGNQIICYVNGLEVIRVTETFNLTATKHGMGANNASAGNIRFEQFYIEVS